MRMRMMQVNDADDNKQDDDLDIDADPTWTWKKYRMRMIKVIWLRHRNVWGRTFWRTRRNTVRLCIAINCV